MTVPLLSLPWHEDEEGLYQTGYSNQQSLTQLAQLVESCQSSQPEPQLEQSQP